MNIHDDAGNLCDNCQRMLLHCVCKPADFDPPKIDAKLMLDEATTALKKTGLTPRELAAQFFAQTKLSLRLTDQLFVANTDKAVLKRQRAQLLAALKAAVNYEGYLVKDERTPKWFHAARAAIAKATQP